MNVYSLPLVATMASQTKRLASIAILLSLVYLSYAKDVKESIKNVGSFSAKEIEERLQVI